MNMNIYERESYNYKIKFLWPINNSQKKRWFPYVNLLVIRSIKILNAIENIVPHKLSLTKTKKQPLES